MRTYGGTWNCPWGTDDPRDDERLVSVAVMQTIERLQLVAKLVAGLRLAAGMPGRDA